MSAQIDPGAAGNVARAGEGIAFRLSRMGAAGWYDMGAAALQESMMKNFMQDFGRVVEGSSGALSFGVIQCLAMAGAVTSLSRLSGIQYGLMLVAALVATIGFFLCIFSVGKVINEVAGKNKGKRALLFVLLYPAAVGVLLSVKISLASLAS